MKYETFDGRFTPTPRGGVWKWFPGLSADGWGMVKKVNKMIGATLNRECPAGMRIERGPLGVNVSPFEQMSFSHGSKGPYGLPIFVFPATMEDLKESLPFLLD